jgi:1-deoxyxylulose-5-phosphate synthase
MIHPISRRRFIQTGSAGVAGAIAGAGFFNLSFNSTASAEVDRVDLGKTGLKVSRIALGTGSRGWKKQSNQSRLGIEGFVGLAKHGYDRGIRFLETADMYGTHPHVAATLKELPREKITLLTKVMVYDHQDWYKTEPFEKSLDRFRKELQTDYIDILLLHCMTNDNWPLEYKAYIDAVSRAQQQGIIKKVGVSCHDFNAMKLAASHPWVEVLLARINHEGPKMDGKPSDVMPVLQTAKDNGKGVIAMKVFGCGDLVSDEQREKSLNYVIKSGNVHCMTLGMESINQMDDNISRVMRISGRA